MSLCVGWVGGGSGGVSCQTQVWVELMLSWGYDNFIHQHLSWPQIKARPRNFAFRKLELNPIYNAYLKESLFKYYIKNFFFGGVGVWGHAFIAYLGWGEKGSRIKENMPI